MKPGFEKFAQLVAQSVRAASAAGIVSRTTTVSVATGFTVSLAIVGVLRSFSVFRRAGPASGLESKAAARMGFCPAEGLLL
jgi:hypothetical protein